MSRWVQFFFFVPLHISCPVQILQTGVLAGHTLSFEWHSPPPWCLTVKIEGKTLDTILYNYRVRERVQVCVRLPAIVRIVFVR